MSNIKKIGLSLNDYPDGFPLGQWIRHQRLHCTDPERRKKLEALPGWSWDIDSEKWNRGFELTKKYGVVRQQDEVEGYKLGIWQTNQRSKCKDPERRKKLESLPDWAWSPFDVKWNLNFRLTQKYGLVPAKTVKEGISLGKWQEHQKYTCKDPERRKKLESIPGWAWSKSKNARNKQK